MGQENSDAHVVGKQSEIQEGMQNAESQTFSRQVQDLYKNNPDEVRQAFNSFNNRGDAAMTAAGFPSMEISMATGSMEQENPSPPKNGTQYSESPDRSSGESHDIGGNSISYQKTADGNVIVNSTRASHDPKGAEKEQSTHTYDNVIAGSAGFNSGGNLSMEIMDPENPQAGKIGDIIVTPDGTETTSYDKNNTTIVRDEPGGDVKELQSDAPGFQYFLDRDEDGFFEPEDLPGGRREDGSIDPENLAQNIQQDADGNLTYDLPKGIPGHDGPVQVSIDAETGVQSYANEKGEVVRYVDPKTGTTLDKRDSNGDGVPEWWEDKPGQEPEQIPPGAANEPQMHDGIVGYNTASQCVILGSKG